MYWTPEKVEAMLKLVEDGNSYLEIAKEINMPRNAIIGKLITLGQESMK